MSSVSLGSGIAIRVDANTVAFGVVGSVHDDGSVDGLMYVTGSDPTGFSGLQIADSESAVIGAAWFPANGLT